MSLVRAATRPAARLDKALQRRGARFARDGAQLAGRLRRLVDPALFQTGANHQFQRRRAFGAVFAGSRRR